jgi:hypothetical protein
MLIGPAGQTAASPTYESTESPLRCAAWVELC